MYNFFFLWSSAEGFPVHHRIHLWILLNRDMQQSMTLSCAWGKDNKDRALGAYKQEWPEIRHSFDEVTMSVLL